MYSLEPGDGMKLPVIQTQRLELVPFREEDIDALHHHWTDPQVRRWLWDDVVIPKERVAETVRWTIEATEASRAALDFAFHELRVPRVYAGADPPNAESFKVMERLGMRLVPEGIPGVPGTRYYVIEAGE